MCVCVCVCVYVYIYKHTHTYGSVYGYVYVCIHIHKYLCISISMSIQPGVVTFGAKCMSAQSGMSYPLASSEARIATHALASFIPTTVTRTRSKPSSAQAMICLTDASTSLVSVVAIVCRTSGWSEPNLTGPAVTVHVLRRVTTPSSSQYLAVSPSAPWATSRGVRPSPPRDEGVQATRRPPSAMDGAAKRSEDTARPPTAARTPADLPRSATPAADAIRNSDIAAQDWSWK